MATNDAARSAITVVRMLRNGDTDGLSALVATMTDDDRSGLCGALGALATACLDTLDQVAAQYSLPGNSAQLLTMMAAGFAAADGQMHD